MFTGEDTVSWEGRIDRIDDNRWRIPSDYMSGMRTDAIIYADESMMQHIRSDNSPQQAANVACLPGIVGDSMAMPDIHFGYGFPIGGVAAVDANEGSISPGGIGFDINCGVRLIKTDLTLDDIGGNLIGLGFLDLGSQCEIHVRVGNARFGSDIDFLAVS